MFPTPAFQRRQRSRLRLPTASTHAARVSHAALGVSTTRAQAPTSAPTPRTAPTRPTAPRRFGSARAYTDRGTPAHGAHPHRPRFPRRRLFDARCAPAYATDRADTPAHTSPRRPRLSDARFALGAYASGTPPCQNPSRRPRPRARRKSYSNPLFKLSSRHELRYRLPKFPSALALPPRRRPRFARPRRPYLHTLGVSTTRDAHPPTAHPHGSRVSPLGVTTRAQAPTRDTPDRGAQRRPRFRRPRRNDDCARAYATNLGA